MQIHVQFPNLEREFFPSFLYIKMINIMTTAMMKNLLGNNVHKLRAI